MLPMQLIYSGKTARSQPTQEFPDGFRITQNPSHWSNEQTVVEYIDNMLKPYIDNQRVISNNPTLPGLLIYDAFRAHTTETLATKLEQLNCKLVQVPKNKTDHLQPLDISVNKLLMGYMKKRLNVWYTAKVMELERVGEQSFETVTNLLKSSVVLCDLSACWFSEMYHYFQLGPQRQIVVNGF